MKIIHTADIHLEQPLKSLGKDKVKERQHEVRESFFNLVDYAKNNNVKVVIISGDLFDKANPTLKIRKEILAKIEGAKDVLFLYLKGNHDNLDAFIDERLTLPLNLKLFNKFNSFKYNHVNITGIDISQYENDNYLKELKLDPKDFNIVTLHGKNDEIPLTKLKGKNIDYLALGDIHIPDIKEKRLDPRGIYGYAGALEPTGFDELGKRGFFLLDINGRKMKRKFIKFNKRTYHIIEVDITGLDNYVSIKEEIIKQTKHLESEDIVRVVLKGYFKHDTIKDLHGQLKSLEDKFYYAELIDKSKLDYKTIDFENEVSLRNSFYHLVKNANLTSEETDKIIEYGLKALKGEDLEI